MKKTIEFIVREPNAPQQNYKLEIEVRKFAWDACHQCKIESLSEEKKNLVSTSTRVEENNDIQAERSEKPRGIYCFKHSKWIYARLPDYTIVKPSSAKDLEDIRDELRKIEAELPREERF